ncbi:gluconate 2-dehydrogenase subunit 3 family protein [Rubrolithibacter danxiaensis]|uniref:gluconate 2-dehydrogenase subunit 3 family protein n=1 Tax=Rubrolithibacter danxiaensis TaxID=3390805 RepID=UPI003BF87AA0
MNRREAVSTVAWLLGGTVLGAELFVELACNTKKSADVSQLFEADHVSFLNEVAETILPETSTPGAKAAKVGEFMGVMVRDCYTPEDQKVFMEGVSKLDEGSQKKYSKKFMELDPKQRTAYLTDLDNEQKQYMKDKKEEDPNHYFRMMKELTLLGYFTSEVGATKALRYVPVPGKYDGCIPYKKGDRAWAL